MRSELDIADDRANAAAQAAVDASIHEDRIVHVDWSPAVLACLTLWGDDSVEANGVHEVWGTESGLGWRVHMAVGS